jgi:hypothetical protein
VLFHVLHESSGEQRLPRHGGLQVLYRELAAGRFYRLDAVPVCVHPVHGPTGLRKVTMRARQKRRAALSVRRLREQTGQRGVDVGRGESSQTTAALPKYSKPNRFFGIQR